MIEEHGTVLAINDGIADVETIRTSTCTSCRARHGCGHHAIAKVSSSNRMLMKAIAPEALEVGQSVTVGIPEDTLLQASTWMYAVPLVGLVAGAAIPSMFTEQSIVSIVGALSGFAGGLWAAKRKSSREANNPDFYPRVLRINNQQADAIPIVQKA
ncbi:sigma E positive regulator RseC/MucC [Marinomonas piezotolerans]|uniref:Sigma E positive regulator RseC/MucC n=1 Tax=Marinomonas piezotolerans TaxID=2213058 RepID=A0A370U927_9GAMM|nr:SoxR reducing system RseC family protein [Marinomonas piezotolerans]RDL44272.1 sigma E positive regulator RseC/MucC [Marinomonas piezotolerans]